MDQDAIQLILHYHTFQFLMAGQANLIDSDPIWHRIMYGTGYKVMPGLSHSATGIVQCGYLYSDGHVASKSTNVSQQIICEVIH